MKSYSLTEIDRWRDRTHRRLPRLRITTKRQAVRFVDDVGFCFVFNTGGADIACLGDALGDAPAEEREPEGHQWHIRSILPDETEAFRGKFLLRRPMLISLGYLPHFLALNGHVRDGSHTVAGGRQLSPTARLILESLLRRSPQSTQDLRRRAAVTAGVGAGALDLALTQLQMTLQVSSLGRQHNGSSGLWVPVRKCFSREVRKARRIPAEEARREILERHFRNQLVLTVAEIRHLFRWDRQQIFQTLGELIRRGIVTPEVQVEGVTDRTYCLLS